MKRLGFGFVIGLLLAIIIGGPVGASPNDFTITRFDADYYLGMDQDGRSTLKTVEKITAEFPSFDQNHGIERAIPISYQSHPTSLKIESVSDDQGRALPFSEHDSNDNRVLRIGDANTFIHGVKTYIITYTQRDVTRYFADTRQDEFYWDVNGTQWSQPFGEVTVRLHIEEKLRPKFTGEMACYYGNEGSRTQCAITDDKTTIGAAVQNLSPRQNMTIAVAFAANTFADYEPTMTEKIIAVIMSVWIVALIITSVVGFVVIFIVAYRYGALSNRKKDMGTIIPEYIPPHETSVLTSAQIGESTRAVLTAQVVDLAVRHYLKIYQTKERSLWRAAEYELEVLKPIDNLTDEEKQFIKTIFGSGSTNIGTRLAMKTLKNDYGIAAKLQKATKSLDKRIKGQYGLRQRDVKASGSFKQLGIGLLVIALLTFSPVLLIAAIVTLVCAAQLYPLTEKGLALRRYLMGLRLYISVAEQERLVMLQSPEGAEKVGHDMAGSPKKLVKLYERVLPYAILFGQEKEWNKQLGIYYEQEGTSPDWYAGSATFNAAVFTSAMNDFSAATNSYAASTSSSSGGSSGGGSSGGGGGGGGGGGW